MWSAIATWDFSLQAIEKAKALLSGGASALDAAEAGVRLVESDPSVTSVGLGGYLNEEGKLELDGAVMDGKTLNSGAVMAVKGFEHPVSIARCVMENTKHSILVGEGAEKFARANGFEELPSDALITDFARSEWEKKRVVGHDTIGCVCLDENDDIAVATSTCGASMKLSGRVGDSPIIGSGFYAENGVGGASATGWGEHIMRTVASFRAVELIRAGMHPQKAAENVILTAHETLKKRGGTPDNMAIVCMNAKGEFGASANHKGFAYARASADCEPAVISVTPVIDRDEM